MADCVDCGRQLDERGDCYSCDDPDGWPPDDDEGSDCHWCGGDGWVECPDPIQCTHEHDAVETQAGHYIQLCPCSSCGGSGQRKDMTIW